MGWQVRGVRVGILFTHGAAAQRRALRGLPVRRATELTGGAAVRKVLVKALSEQTDRVAGMSWVRACRRVLLLLRGCTAADGIGDPIALRRRQRAGQSRN